MTKAVDGQIMTLKEALVLEDAEGEQIKFKQQDDGSYSSEPLKVKGTKDKNGKELPGHLYTYALQLNAPVMFRVNVTKNVDSPQFIAESNVPVDEKEKEKAVKAWEKQQEEANEQEGSTEAEENTTTTKVKEGKWVSEQEFKKANKK